MRLIKILIAAVAGSLCGAALRQVVEARKRTGDEKTDLVIAAPPVGIVAGVAAGLLFRGPVLAFIVAANVGANADPAVLAGIAERFRPGDTPSS
ncbi:MAG: hypothetical protein ACR2NL_00610 [Acidimicrobiia bacterium]